MSSPAPTLLICLAYLLVVRVLGPLVMQGREPLNLKYPMLAYNLFQVLFNGWIFLGEQIIRFVTPDLQVLVALVWITRDADIWADLQFPPLLCLLTASVPSLAIFLGQMWALSCISSSLILSFGTLIQVNCLYFHLRHDFSTFACTKNTASVAADSHFVCFRGRKLLVRRQVQLGLSGSGLLHQPGCRQGIGVTSPNHRSHYLCPPGSVARLVVLSLKVHWLLRLDILHTPEEVWPPLPPPRNPPQHTALHVVVWSQVCR